MKYPPFRFISYVLFKGKEFEKAHKVALEAKNYLQQFQDDEFIVMGPSVPYIAKLNNEFRIKIMLKYKNKEKTLEKLKDLKLYLKGDNNIKVNIVVDPYVEI